MSDSPSKPTSTPKNARSKAGCKTCRARKVRCDERPGGCVNCERLGLTCVSIAATGAADANGRLSASSGTVLNGISSSVVGLKRKRTYRSCGECRASKTRCSGDKPICVRCKARSLACAHDDAGEPVWKQQLKHADSRASSRATGIHRGNDGQRQERQETTQQHEVRSGNDVRLEVDIEPESIYRASSHTHWLHASELPSKEETRALVEHYFAHVHPLRCFGFLHKPSFMQRLDADRSSDRENDPLLLIVCALGALFYAIEVFGLEDSDLTLNAGSRWAKRAQQLILAELDAITTENLMATVLLHDYELRMSHFGIAFMLSGITARMAQALQINLEHSTDVLCQKDEKDSPTASTKESRRRLMWCCYITDSFVGSGVDQLTLIKDEDIKIQLPCTERNFLLQNACVVETLQPGHFLRFLPAENLPSTPWDNMGIRASYLRHIRIRRKVLKYIKHLDVAKMPWLPDSEFVQLDAECRAWYDSLPASLQFTPTAMYIRRETSQLGALIALHMMYHQNMCDLYRIGAPALYKLRSAFSFPPEQVGFLTHLQKSLFAHAKAHAMIIGEALRHGPHALADQWMPTIAYDGCRIMLHHITQLIDPTLESSKEVILETIPLVQNNVEALKVLQSMYAVADLLHAAAEKMLARVVNLGAQTRPSGRSIIPDEPYPEDESETRETSRPGTPAQTAPDYVLNPLSIYRMARKAIPEKHEPEKQPHASSPVLTSDNRSSIWRSTPQQQLRQIQYDTSNQTTMGIREGADATSSLLPSDSTGLDELLTMFTSDPSGLIWQPSDTALGSQMESNSLPPWEPAGGVDPQLDAWMPSMGQGQFGYS